jgi:hypothetical protein
LSLEEVAVKRREFLCGGICAASGLAAGTGAAAAPKADEPTAPLADGLKLVAYCGLYCGLCSGHGKVPKLAGALAATLKQDERDKALNRSAEGRAFWKQLNDMAKLHPDRCCRTEKCGAGFCSIRKCAKKRNVRVCPECKDYPCKRIHVLAASETTLLHDGRQMQKIGLAQWIAQQKQRAEAGFCYSDIRCIPCTIPRD